MFRVSHLRPEPPPGAASAGVGAASPETPPSKPAAPSAPAAARSLDAPETAAKMAPEMQAEARAETRAETHVGSHAETGPKPPSGACAPAVSALAFSADPPPPSAGSGREAPAAGKDQSAPAPPASPAPRPRLKLLLLAASLDGTDIGEVEWAFHWVEELARRAEVTVLASSREGRVPLAAQLPGARVVTWPEPAFLYRRFERLNAMAKPGWPLFAHRARRWIKAALARGERFDIAHQILPQAMRHASPLRGLGIPYVMGAVGGALETPAAFAGEVAEGSSLASRLRAIDAWRLDHDPRLRESYRQADLVIGVAPYVAERLAGVGLKRFHPMLERGHGEIPPARPRDAVPGQLKLLHAGRVVRTKGLRDAIRALSHLRDLPGITLTSAGAGEDLEPCRAEVARLGLEDRVTLLGRVPREEVERLYEASDVFCFPSFREPMGGVLFEAMAHGLPVVTAARGGPDFIIDDASGLRIPVTDPERYPRDIAAGLRGLALDPAHRLALGHGARERLRSFGSWGDKAETLLGLYHEILATRAAEAQP